MSCEKTDINCSQEISNPIYCSQVINNPVFDTPKLKQEENLVERVKNSARLYLKQPIPSFIDYHQKKRMLRNVKRLQKEHYIAQIRGREILR